MRSKKRPAAHSAIRIRQSAPLPPAPLITLTTDFGAGDYFVGSVKGVLLQRLPSARLVDISHEIAPQDLISAAFILKEISSYFPPRTVHLAVVDPGVGTDRRKIIAVARDQSYVAPDNGILTHVLQRDGCRAFAVEAGPDLPLKESPTFAGRDHFAPIAARLAEGIPPERLGREIDDAVTIEGLVPKIERGRIVGKVVYLDRFGNAITNITSDLLKGRKEREIILLLKGKRLAGLKRNYAAGEKGSGNLIINSSGHLEIFIPNGRAAEQLRLRLLDEVTVDA